MNFRFGCSCVGLLIFILLPSLAFAYVGPGAGLSAIGTVLALIGAVLLGIVGFVWYPIKRLLRGKKAKEESKVSAATDDVTAEVHSVAKQTDGSPQDT